MRYPTDMIAPVGGWTGGDHSGSHRHGMHKGSKQYSYPIDQPAATLWHHDHRMDFTGPQVYKGLAGFHLIRDDEEERLGLPHGERDIPLMICDQAFTEDGSFDYPAVDPTLRDTPGTKGNFISGVLGDCILINGAPWPIFEVTNTRYRFRILNGRPRGAVSYCWTQSPAKSVICPDRQRPRPATAARQPRSHRDLAGRAVRCGDRLLQVRGRRPNHAQEQPRARWHRKCHAVCGCTHGDRGQQCPFALG
jgi:Multicopper oxidase